jgi:hypothetical protein
MNRSSHSSLVTRYLSRPSSHSSRFAIHEPPDSVDKESYSMATIIPEDLHPHLRARMEQRGVTQAEIELAMDDGWEAKDAKQGMLGKVMVFEY